MLMLINYISFLLCFIYGVSTFITHQYAIAVFEILFAIANLIIILYY